MNIKVGGSYVSEAAYSFAASAAREEEKDSGEIQRLAEKFPNLKFSIGTSPFSGTGLNNVSISPKILRQMENDPEKRIEYEALIYDIAHTEVQGNATGRKLKSHGFIIGDDGGLRGWGISTEDDGNRRSQSSIKRSEKKNWWQEMLNPPKKKKSFKKALHEKPAGKHREDELLLRANTEKTRGNPGKKSPTLAKEAYLQYSRDTGESAALRNTEEFSRYLQEHFVVARDGLASISSQYLRECLTDEEKRKKLFENLRVADEMLENRQGEVGFQGMRVMIDEDGEMTAESSKSTVTVNESKRKRQIAAAATQDDMKAVLELLQQDLQQVEDGLRQNMCDEAEVEKVKKLIEEAKQQMATLPDRASTPEEQSAMSVNMLI